MHSAAATSIAAEHTVAIITVRLISHRFVVIGFIDLVF
jgi:hypothetical protein